MESGDETLIMRGARGLFFLGSMTVCEVGLRPGAGITVCDAMFLASFVFSCFAVLRGQRIERVPTSLVAGVALFAIGGAASALSAHAPGQATYEVGRAIWVMLLWPWTASMVLRNRRHIAIAILLFGVSGAVNALAGIAQVDGFSAFVGHTHSHRATGFTGHPNDFGGAAAVALVPVVALAIRFPAWLPRLRLIRWALPALLIVSLVLSGSVAAIAAAGLGIVLFMIPPLMRGAARGIVLVLLVAVVLITSVAGSQATSPAHRVSEVLAAQGSNANTGSGQSRLNVIAAAWPRIRRDPFVGTGMGATNIYVPVISHGLDSSLQVHNAPVAAWYETGILGLAGLLLVFGSFLLAGWRALGVTAGDLERVVGWALLCGYLVFIIYAMTAPLYFQQYGWFAAALLLAWANFASRMRTPTRKLAVLQEPETVMRRPNTILR